MEIVEQYLAGKHPDPVRCEDAIVVTDRLVAVIDGVTDKSGIRFPSPDGPVAGGRLVAQTVAAALQRLRPGTEALEAVRMLTSTVDATVRASVGPLDQLDLPGASVVVYDDTLRAVWRVGDCPFRLDGHTDRGVKRIDEVTGDFRAALVAAMTAEELHSADEIDPARAAVLPLLRRQTRFANTVGEFGYGVINGTPVPACHIDVLPVPDDARELVLTSDGYPTTPASLAAAEADLQRCLAADPWCVAELRSTKRVRSGFSSFDDRAWIRVRL